ncbi:TolC family protein [Phenylobacterium hankyongense]|uniref:TolC family protein n=1 Tax=Phenylobacterium hankyongense TaxID=1813876 RepID=UPI0014033D37|nr:TolC family protein [Phenylobacterium hankyongense]
MSDLRQRPAHAVAAALLAIAAAAGLSGCAMYNSRPLPTAPALADNPQRLKADLARLRVGPLKTIRIDPSDGLTPTEVAVLAVLNNSDLEAKRRATRVNEAQVFAAGLLPDPQIAASVDNPIAGPDNQVAYSLAASVDLAGLLQRTYTRRAARFTAREADLNVLWAEWGVAQQARQFAETALAAEARVVFLRQVLALATDRSDRSERALQHRDVNLQTAAADLAVKLDAQAQLATALHDAQKARRDLNALLNLRAEVMLPLVTAPVVAAYDDAAMRQALADLPQRRPDLLALKAGYAAQDVNVRKAVLAQFPLNNIGAAYAKDTAGVVTDSLQAAFALPIFNGGRGEVRTQKATREQLHAEYQARLDQTDAEVRNAQAELIAARSQAAVLRQDVPRLEALVKPAVAAYDRGDIDSQTYLTLSQTALSRRADLDDKELAARLAEIALETALFLPPADSRAAQ